MGCGRWVSVGVAATVLAVSAAGWAVLLGGGTSARRDPGAVESRVARAFRDWAIPAEAREAHNPVPASAHVISLGLAHFADHCAGCHGNDGSGQTGLGRGLYPRAPDLRKPATQGLTDGQLFYLIENGVRFTGMPGWGGSLGSAEASWHLVRFIRHLPELTNEEKAQMEALNPKSPAEWRAQQEEDSFLRGETPAPDEAQHGGHEHH
jgi:mono/diheme cytochrome c family protein